MQALKAMSKSPSGDVMAFHDTVKQKRSGSESSNDQNDSDDS